MPTIDFRQSYQRFIFEANEQEIVWNLQSDDGFAICESSQTDGILVMPFWSQEADAKIACVDDWSSYRPNPIRIDDFIDAWLHGLEEDNTMVGINWDSELVGVEIEPVIVIDDLLDED